MCFTAESRPPILPIAGGSVEAREVVLTGEDGAQLRAWHAIATEPGAAGILVLPDQRGLHPYYEELAMRFAERGFHALAIDWYGRTAGVARRGPDFDEEPHIPGLSYESLTADLAAAAAHLRSEAGGAVSRLFVVGFCLGGRLGTVAAAGDLQLAGVVGFYGRPTGPIVWGGPAPIEVIDRLNAPILGIFAGRDQYIPTEGVERYRGAPGGRRRCQGAPLPGRAAQFLRHARRGLHR